MSSPVPGQVDVNEPEAAARPTPPLDTWPVIARDVAATGGGASFVQRVIVSHPDGTEAEAYVKFARDVTGRDLAEHGAQGVASELLASKLAGLIGARTPTMLIVVLPPGVAIQLRELRQPEPGLAVASHAIRDLMEINNRDSLRGFTNFADLAALRILHRWIEVQDRGHNMALANGDVYSLDHASGFRSSWEGREATGVDVPDALMDGIFDEHPEELEEAALVLQQADDTAVDAAVDSIPDELMPPDTKTLMKANLKKLRDTVARQILLEVDNIRQNPERQP